MPLNTSWYFCIGSSLKDTCRVDRNLDGVGSKSDWAKGCTRCTQTTHDPFTSCGSRKPYPPLSDFHRWISDFHSIERCHWLPRRHCRIFWEKSYLIFRARGPPKFGPTAGSICTVCVPAYLLDSASSKLIKSVTCRVPIGLPPAIVCYHLDPAFPDRCRCCCKLYFPNRFVNLTLLFPVYIE